MTLLSKDGIISFGSTGKAQVSVSDFANKKSRTLISALNYSLNYLHIYLEDEFIHVLIHRDGKVISHVTGTSIEFNDFMLSIYQKKFADFEFVRLLNDRCSTLIWATHRKEGDKTLFYDMTLSELVQG
jgi:hypothetical protein